ncbi:nonribosomal peptide synthetase lcsA [Trichoderma asperellum]|uniref:Nonribosomal peptide synthetase lcsA n=1 Tax=Trichoderma asperellum TaxID=101201 RepID=A0A6V8QZQ4_TRIAP|nr:nonribosomal peptide synthetase lcsA [Trichoderma asperellum]
MATEGLEMRHKMERELLKDEALRQAKILNLASPCDEPQWTVAISLAKEVHGHEQVHASAVIKRARKLLRKMKDDDANGNFSTPKKWIVLDELPITSTGQVDERALYRLLNTWESTESDLSPKEKRARLAAEAVRANSHPASETGIPTQETELVLRELWSRVLNTEPQDIGGKDSFLSLGGDSIIAIELVALAEKYGIGLTAATIVSNPVLANMAAMATLDEINHVAYDVEPLGQLEKKEVDTILNEIRTKCELPDDSIIRDAFPCTALQAGIMALAEKQPGSYMTRQIYELPNHVDVSRFKLAWQKTVERCDNLRTRVLPVNGQTIQAVIEGDTAWEETASETMDSFASKAKRITMTYGSRLCRYALVRNADGKSYFVWIIHHAIFDGLSARLTLDILYQLYYGQNANALRPYSGFIKYTQSIDQDAASSFWKKQLQDARRANFPRALNSKYSIAGRAVAKEILFPYTAEMSITKATILRAAWAIVLARYCDTDDVCFGTTVSGRQAPVPGINQMAGLIIATAPIRVRLMRDESVAKFLQDIQTQASEMVEFEQYGLQNIARLGDDARDACNFSSLFVIQPSRSLSSTADSKTENAILLRGSSAEQELSDASMQNYFNYPLVLETFVEDGHVDLRITYDTNSMSEGMTEALFHHFDHVVQQLLRPLNRSLSTITLAGEWDLELAKRFNSEEPEIVDLCFHQMVENQALRRPSSVAICAWDGTFTYRDLSRASNRLAHHLVNEYNVQKEDLVHVCFEKSAWYLIAILAINKAGAAWVPLDPSHPQQRLKQIVSQTKAKLALASPTCSKLCNSLTFERDVFQMWAGRRGLRLITGWGPAETCVYSSMREFKSADESNLNIGRQVGGYCWIVDPSDPQQLAPIGVVGEIVIQGPTISREYLNDPKKTSDAIITTLPDWAPRRESTYWNRFYKSGDLAYYNPDGTMEFVSRKDTQVKIKGFRVELGEIEHHIRATLNGVSLVVVDILKRDANSQLVAYFSFSKERCAASELEKESDDMFLQLTEGLREKVSVMVGELNTLLPQYMIPTLFIPCRYMPANTSLKLDRKLLRNFTQRMNQEELIQYSLSARDKRKPETEIEIRMQNLWSEALKIATDLIGRDDSFLQIGGDSLTAIHLVAAARKAGLSLTVKDIFDDPRLRVVASKTVVAHAHPQKPADIPPFSLLGDSLRGVDLTKTMRSKYNLPEKAIVEDAFPCTSLQQGLLALSMTQSGSYIAKQVYRLSDDIDIAKFRSAWEKTLSLCSNLRTRIVPFGDAAIQVIINGDDEWDSTEGLSVETYIQRPQMLAMGHGTRLCRPYANFVNYTMVLDRDAAVKYWSAQLQGAQQASFPPAVELVRQSEIKATRVLTHIVRFPSLTNRSITKASVLRAAWAIVLGRYCDTDDICFGTVSSGRNADVQDLESIPGLVVATVPVRVRIDHEMAIGSFLQMVQSHTNDMIPYEQFGLQEILKLSEEAKQACNFTSLLTLQPMQVDTAGGSLMTPVTSGRHEALFSSEDSLTYAELDGLSDALATHLLSFGVGPEVVVPFCMEKSVWAIVAMLAIMKAGGVYLPLDPSHPVNRRKMIVTDVGASIVIVSPSTSATYDSLTEHIFVLSRSTITELSASLKNVVGPTKRSSPSNAAYVLFTSGSTGKPKGTVIEHAAVCTSIQGFGKAAELSNNSRSLQFSAFTFDISVAEILGTLVFGGTVCIPSERERLQGIPEFVRQAKVNIAFLTPSFLRTMSPSEVPDLKAMMLVGEAAARDTLDAWCDHVRLVNLYLAGGSMEYLGRKDKQVKLRGHRIELGEIEATIKRLMPDVAYAAAEVLRRDIGDSIIAFISYKDNDIYPSENIIIPLEQSMREQLAGLLGNLRHELPGYMVPSLVIPLRDMPFNAALKLDRGRLLGLIKDWKTEQLTVYSLSEKDRVAPTTEMEVKLQRLWAKVLKIDVETIGKNDPFFEIGGDSLSAIRLSSLANQHGIKLPVDAIFADSKLSSMAIVAAAAGNVEREVELAPFSLLPFEKTDAITKNIRHQCKLSDTQAIQDIYPCSALQEGLMALTVTKPGSYIAKNAYKIPAYLDIAIFKAAWEKTISLCDNLRTRILIIKDVCVQVVLDHDVSWEEASATDAESYVLRSQNVRMDYGSRLSHYSILETENGEAYFFWTIHHAIFDGWTLGIIINTLTALLRNEAPPTLVSMRKFVKYFMDMDVKAANKYWLNQLRDTKPALFPPRVSRREATTEEKRTNVLTSTMKFSPSRSTITKATVIRAAWAIILAKYCDSDDVCFGTTVSGRTASIPGLESMPGVTIATVPVRIRLSSDVTLSNFLERVQIQGSEMVAYEQFGLQNITKLSPQIKEACDFSSLMVVQPSGGDDPGSILEALNSSEEFTEERLQNYFTYPLILHCFIGEESVKLVFIYDTTLLAESQIRVLSFQFENVIQQLVTPDERKLTDVNVAGDSDFKYALAFNGQPPEIVEECIHTLIDRAAAKYPNLPAVSAWDAELTYKELIAAADRLANHLVTSHNVQIGDIIHVCFEKSAWYVVATLAISKTGAAWSPLDPAHPLQRHKQVVSQTGSSLVLASPSNVSRCARLVKSVLEVSEKLNTRLMKEGRYENKLDVNVTPQHLAYILFTSGSTGTPKGVLIEHLALSSAQMAASKRIGHCPGVRMLQFASYAFDASVAEIISPLLTGACVCIPSWDTQMNGLTQYICDAQVTWAMLTPSFARTIQPDSVPCLQMLMLVGEAVGRDVFELWFGKIRLLNGWGPTEACVYGAIHEWKSREESQLTVGQSIGGFCWIVDANNPTKLAPIGTLGEVIIQGPNLLREYLGDEKKTALSTMQAPEWAPYQDSPYWRRCYKTGDLAMYNPDGSIQYHSRKDMQVKIRGLRIELGDIEHHVHTKLDGICQVAVDVLKTDISTGLAAFVCFNNDTIAAGTPVPDDLIQPLTEDLKVLLHTLRERLNSALPTYMMPAFFITCSAMPLATSGKLDRKMLLGLTKQLDRQELIQYTLEDGERIRELPQTDMERRLQQMWNRW